MTSPSFDLAGQALIWTAAAAMVAALLLYARNERAHAGPVARVTPPLAGRWLWLLLAALAAGLMLRVIGLDLKGVSHPEIYIPGIALPPGLSEPPPRHGFIETWVWHFRSEPHPMGYYIGMWGWTKLFGATTAAIRLPEALFGALSVLAIYRVGALAWNIRTGAIAAGLLALSGFHIYWSQIARMYVPGAFFGLLATLLLLEMARIEAPNRLVDHSESERPRRRLELAYLLTVLAGASTVEFFWPLMAMFLFWTALNTPPGTRSRLVMLQILAMLLVFPSLAHGIMLGGAELVPAPTLLFLGEYFGFGFLFGGQELPFVGTPFALALLALALLLLARGLAQPTREPVWLATTPLPRALPLWLAAFGASAAVAGMALIAPQRHRSLAGAALLPWLVLALPWLIAKLRPWLAFADPWRLRARGVVALVPLLAVLPALGLWAVSFVVHLTAPRAFLTLVPYLLLVIAAGLASLAPRLRLAAGAFVTALFVLSVLVQAQVPVSPRDYRGLAQAIEAHAQPGDLVFVPPKRWEFTPLYFYLDNHRLVGSDFAAVVAAHPDARIWVPTIALAHRVVAPGLNEALAGYSVGDTVAASGGFAAAYVPPPR